MDPEETRKILDLEWTKLDVLNKFVLVLRGALVGTVFAKHRADKIYHDGDMICAV